MSFSSTSSEVKAKVELGMRSVQPFGGYGQHVEAANTPDASVPHTSTPKAEGHISTGSVLLSPRNAGTPILRKSFVNKPTIDVFTDIGESVLL